MKTFTNVPQTLFNVSRKIIKLTKQQQIRVKLKVGLIALNKSGFPTVT